MQRFDLGVRPIKPTPGSSNQALIQKHASLDCIATENRAHRQL
jgi:hypothetical protein